MELGFIAKVSNSLDRKMASNPDGFVSKLTAAERDIYEHRLQLLAMSEDEYFEYKANNGLVKFVTEFNARWFLGFPFD